MKNFLLSAYYEITEHFDSLYEMIDLNSISINTFKYLYYCYTSYRYLNHLLQSKCKEDEKVRESIQHFIDSSRRYIVSF